MEVPDAVASCRKAGIQVRMVTGDNKNTAVAIARKCGLLRSNGECEEGEVMEGAEFRKYVLAMGAFCFACPPPASSPSRSPPAFQSSWKTVGLTILTFLAAHMACA